MEKEEKKRVRIFCMGDCNYDMIVPIDKLPKKGGCGFSKEYLTNTGGTMANTLTALHSLGMDVWPVSKIGNNDFSKQILAHFEKLGIPTDYMIRTDEHPTPLVIGLVEPDGEKYWISIRLDAADRYIKEEEVSEFPIPDILYLTGVMIEEGLDTRFTSIKYAKKVHENGGMVYLDPSIRVPDGIIAQDVKEAFFQLMPYVDGLLANEEELQMLGGCKEIEQAAKKMLQLGAGSLWVKLGGNGCRYVDDQQDIYFPPAKVKVVDTSGAGDSFNAALLFAIDQGYSISQIGKFANLYAGYVVEHYGTTDALPNREDVQLMISLSCETN